MIAWVIWRFVDWRLRRALPPDRAAAVIGDLLEDFDRRVRRDGRLRAERWLLREVRSVGRSYRAKLGRSGASRAPRAASQLNGVLFDLRLAVRSLRRQPILALVIVTTVGLAVAVNTSLFSIFDGLLFRPLPYPGAERIVHVETPREVLLAMSNDDRTARSEALAATSLFDDRAGAYAAVILEDGAEGVEEWNLRPSSVTPDLFPLLGVHPVLGRLFTDDDTTVTDVRSVIIGFDLWQRRFDGDSAIVGRTVDVPGAIFGRRFEIVGILPEGIAFPDAAQLWTAAQDRPGDNRAGAKRLPGHAGDAASRLHAP